MKPVPPLGLVGLLACVVVVLVAAVTRVGYVMSFCDGGGRAARFAVQEPGSRADLPSGMKMRGQFFPGELDELVDNLQQHRWFGSLAPLSDVEERTAHVPPGYGWLV